MVKEQPPTDVIAEPVADDVEITAENAGIVTTADGVEHVGEIPADPEPLGPTRFTNISPLGDLDIPGLGIIPAGAEIEVQGALAAQFIAQPDNWKQVSQ